MLHRVGHEGGRIPVISIASRIGRGRFSRMLRNFCMASAGCLVLGMSAAQTTGPNCSRTYSLALHDHGLLYSSSTDTGIDKDFSEELMRRSGCKIAVSLMSRARIWQLIQSGGLDFSLSGIANRERLHFASFAWYFSNKYYLLVRKDAGMRQLADFESDNGFHVGVIRSFRYSRSANHLIDKLTADNRVIQAGGLDPLYQALLSNRIQGMIMEPFDYPVVEEKQIRDVTRIIEFNDPSVPHGLIMSNKSLPAEEREKWRVLVETMRADGTVRHIFEKYFPPSLAASMVEFRAEP